MARRPTRKRLEAIISEAASCDASTNSAATTPPPFVGHKNENVGPGHARWKKYEPHEGEDEGERTNDPAPVLELTFRLAEGEISGYAEKDISTA